MSEFEILTIRKLADRAGQERIRKFDAETGQPKLVNPATPGEDHEPWPLLGVTIEGEPPARTTAGMSWVTQGQSEGWLRRIGERAVVRPGGPESAPWAVPHTFIHADKISIEDTARGETIVYKVTRQPDKYGRNGIPVQGWALESSVVWFYEMELESRDG